MFRLEYRIPVAVDLGRKMVGKYFHRETPGREWARWLVFLAVLFGTPGGPALAQNSLRIAAIVNDEAISVYDLNSRVHLALLSSRLPNDAATRRRMQAQILRNLIDEKLKLQEAKKLKITVEKKEIDQAIAELEGRNKMQPGAMRKYLRRRGLDRSTLTSQIEANIAWMKMVSRNVRAQGKIGDDLIDEALARMEANKGKPEYLISEIFLPFGLAAAAGKIEEFTTKLVVQIGNGADFGAVARTFSASPSAAIGGQLGWMRSDQIDNELAKVLFGMGIGKLSPPIRTVGGFYILRLRGKRFATSLANTEIVLNLHQIFLPLTKGAGPETVRASRRCVR